MASLFERKRNGKRCSPVWYIKYRNSKGVICREPTPFVIGVGADTRRADQLRAEHTLRESKLGRAKTEHRWGNWVPQYLATRYVNQPATLTRYRSVWRTLMLFLDERQILTPHELAREHCADYMEWRKTPDPRRDKHEASHNTARFELKRLANVMREAVLRHYASFNPCLDLDIKHAKVKEKPELAEEATRLILHSLELEPEPRRTMLRNSFLIARYHGARIAETHLNPMTAVVINGERSQITFLAKGNKEHTVRLHPKLIPLFQELQAKGATESYPYHKSPSNVWSRFLKRIGVTAQIVKDGKPFGPLIPRASFHSTRVTVASVLSRKGLSERQIMAYMGHASTTVARAYVRWRPEDLSGCADAIS